MQYDRKIVLTVGNSRRSINWQPQILMLSEFYEKLKIPTRSTETLREYLNLKKSEQDDRKDIGGFVAGSLSGTRRKAGAVIGRDLITLDFDNIPPGETKEVLRRVDGLGCGYCVYSTRKHSPTAPRLRILIPFDRTANADEYEPAARYIANLIGMDFADPTTFEASRLMYWPGCSSDGEYVFMYADKPMLSVDGLLAQHGDRQDVNSWPQVPGTENSYRRMATKQFDPLAKSGIIGAFCRTYDIYSAMETFLPGIYIPVDDSRYTYSKGTTTGGAVIYDNGLFLYSHHSTDPCCGKLVNAFDMVRLHKFGDADDEAAANTPTNRLPSYQMMCELATTDTKIAKQPAKERAESAVSDFAHISDDENSMNWATELELNKQTGAIKPTIDNIWIILENDPNLRGKFALNEFTGRGEIPGELPWSSFSKRRAWSDNDNQGLYWYFEKAYKITGNGKIDGALSLHSEKHKFNDVKNYLMSLQWDGVKRLDTLFVEYLGAENTNYVRTVTRKAFVAAVAGAMNPGCKYDTMLILAGAQGLGKSTLLDKMSKGWFNDGIRTFEGKEAGELLQGVWLIEIQEPDAFRKTDVAGIKQFLSLRYDRFRAAYGRHVKDIPRCCVFFGTTNTSEFLRDRTGNRRFRPVDVGRIPRKKNVWEHLTDNEINQIRAEAILRRRVGENLHLIGEAEEEAKAIQEEHRETSVSEGLIMDFIEKPVPEDWQKWPLEKRRMFLNGEGAGEAKLIPRDKICAVEIRCEMFNGHIKDLPRATAIEINEVISSFPGWMPCRNRFGIYGFQRGFQRVTKNERISQLEKKRLF